MRKGPEHTQVAPAPPQPSFSLPSKLILLSSSIAFGVMVTLSACIREPKYQNPRNDLERLMVFACQYLIQEGGMTDQSTAHIYKMPEGEFRVQIEDDNAWIHIWNEEQEVFEPLAFTTRGGMWEVYEKGQTKKVSVAGRLGKLL